MAKVQDAKELAKLLDARHQAIQLPDAWDPDKGDVVQGRVYDMRTVNTKDKKGNPRTARVLLVETDDGKVSIWEGANLTAQLDQLIADGSLKPGAEIACRYEGEVKTAAGNRCKVYTLLVL